MAAAVLLVFTLKKIKKKGREGKRISGEKKREKTFEAVEKNNYGFLNTEN